MKVGCILQGIWPQSKVDHIRPAGACVEQLLLCTFQEVPDGSLGNAILKVGIDPTEGELLLFVMEASVFAVIMEDLDSMIYSILFKGKLSSECFVRLVIELEVDNAEAAEVVDKDGGALIVLLGKFALQLCIKTYYH